MRSSSNKNHLAGLYGIDTRSLIQALKRNIRRFPADLVVELTKSEFDALRSQIVISKRKTAAPKVEELERRYDAQFKVVFDAIRALMKPPELKWNQIGFQVK